MINLLQAKILSFELAPGKILLNDALPLRIYDEFSTLILLKAFDVVEETATTVSFRWSYGFQFVPASNALTISDFDHQSTSAEKVMVNTLSVIRSIKMAEGRLK
jgi:hypothetical protein